MSTWKRLAYQNRNSSFDESLKVDKLVSIHYRSWKCLFAGICKDKMGLSPPIMNGILTLDQNALYNLISGVTVTRRNIKTNKFDFETISTIGVVLWGDLPNNIKNTDSLNIFKYKIKQWKPDNCPCKMSRNFIQNLVHIGKRHIYAPLPFLRSVLWSLTLFNPRVFAGLIWKLKIEKKKKIENKK